MKVEELNPEILVAMINAASNIAAAKIRTIGDEFNRDHNFFSREFGRVIEGVMKEVNKE
ncbi:hypothetical protein X824_gp188 [Escherichia phage 4MG]|uniref:Hyphothetical protein n=1 Tax=Escherichia phage 4MG TaxID=1391428 RepID=V5KSM3_9CAUD|nr:hypothetical protein X824_gp188 [Escherichia phage 4MG]AGZ17635.1 hyphothetical protein [Escherichia phage 4MG]